MRSHGSEPGADSPAPTRTDGHGGDARFGQDRGEQESVGADGDESSSVRDNDDFAGNIGRRTSNSGQGGSHGLLGRGGEASIGGMGGYGREGGRGMFDDPRGESAGGQRDAGQIQPGASDDSHAGRGPRSFHRSDVLLNEEIHERLSGHAELDAHDIDVQVQDGEATLSGSVNDRRSKHFAEDVVVAVFGVRDVINHLKVRR